MRNILTITTLVLLAAAFGCSRHQAIPQQYIPESHALLIGKADCITPGWLDDSRRNVKLEVYKLEKDNTRKYMTQISSRYSAIPLEPGIYCINKSRIEIQYGLLYDDAYFTTSNDTKYSLLFEPNAWNDNEIDRTLGVQIAAPNCFGVIKVEAGDIIYYGDITLDLATTKDNVMFTISRAPERAVTALNNKYSLSTDTIRNGEWTGGTFLFGKIRKSSLTNQ